MRGGAAAVEQTGPSKQHRTGANRSDSPDSSGDLSEPANDVRVYFVLLNRIAAGDEQSVDLTAHFSKSFVRSDAQPAIRYKRSVSRSSDDFDRIDRRRTGILFTEHFRGAGKDLERPDQIKNLGSRRGYEHDAARPRLGRLLIIKCHSFLSAVANLSGAESNVFLSSSEQK